jgi:hypothetical protein
MEGIDKVWDALGKLPLLLDQYSGYSYPLLAVLLVGGGALLGAHYLGKRRGADGLSIPVFGFSILLVFLSVSGFALKWMGGLEAEQARREFIARYRAPDDEHWLLIFDFALPGGLDERQRQDYLNQMQNLVGTITEVLLEDMPVEFPQPRVIHVHRQDSPWKEGIGPQNYDDVITRLNAFEIMWGNIHSQGWHAKAFLGISEQLARDFETMIPLKDFVFDRDPRLEHQFGDGYYRLLGLVTLGMALDTYQRARQAAGEERKALFLKATQQFTQARAKVNNRREDPVLRKNLFDQRLDVLIDDALREAGVSL